MYSGLRITGMALSMSNKSELLAFFSPLQVKIQNFLSVLAYRKPELFIPGR
jgi:hypothetical protein